MTREEWTLGTAVAEVDRLRVCVAELRKAARELLASVSMLPNKAKSDRLYEAVADLAPLVCSPTLAGRGADDYAAQVHQIASEEQYAATLAEARVAELEERLIWIRDAASTALAKTSMSTPSVCTCRDPGNAHVSTCPAAGEQNARLFPKPTPTGSEEK